MTSTELEVRPVQVVALSSDQLRFIANTEFVPPGLRGNLPAIMACVATGRELGIGDLAALRSIHVIDGRPSYSAELMVQLVRRAGHSITGEFGPESCTVVGTRADNGDSIPVTWTMQMAERAGLANKTNWKRYPEAMLWARAVAQLCRMLFADCFAAGTYTAEELEDSGLGPQAEEIAEAPTTAPLVESTVSAAPVTAGQQPSNPEQAPPADTAASGGPPATEAQLKKLNVLVGQLREAGHITTEQLYLACHRDPADGFGDDAQLHWSPLRDSLSKAEASDLIERLGKYAAAVVG